MRMTTYQEAIMTRKSLNKQRRLKIRNAFSTISVKYVYTTRIDSFFEGNLIRVVYIFN